MGYHMDGAFLGIAVACIVNLMSTMVVVLIVDKVGRKPLLIFGGLIMGVSMLALGSLFRSQAPGMFGLAAICFYLAGFAISFGPIVWIMMTEIYPAPIRGQAMSIAVAVAMDREPAGVGFLPAAVRQRDAERRVEPRLPILDVRQPRHPRGIHRAAFRARDARRRQRTSHGAVAARRHRR